MTLVSLILAFVIEQFRPLDGAKYVSAPLSRLADFFQYRFNDGIVRHGAMAWLLAVVPAVVAVAAVYLLLYRVQPLLALAWNLAVLYLGMGFRRASQYFTDVQAALRAGELARARALLGHWRGHLEDRASSEEVARLSIEEALLTSHRRVFAIVFWMVVLPGPAGVVLYRMAEHLGERWAGRGDPELRAFGWFAGRVFEAIDWLPARITAASFAIVGDFEDAIYCWRSQAARWADRASGILLASGAGALGVRLGMPVYESGEITDRPEIGLGDDADADFMQSAVGLIWRTVVLCLLILALLTVATWVGN
jgi:adenosylcobinamide-phosphate synthase